MASPLAFASINQAQGMVALRTFHLPEEEAETVATLLANRVIKGASAHREWFVISADFPWDCAGQYPHEAAHADLPVLCSLAKEARSAGLRWLMLDPDARPVPGLPIHDWKATFCSEAAA
ncbi:hypothetical protein [Halomonas sp. THAF12]|uniref:DUF5983 family protein n=1 Tax=Halomonas sp. THAF12 TaxID=2587849 RepID=UPI001267F0CF|nr:hypothetical protein [Halomonas sp. THAF12]